MFFTKFYGQDIAHIPVKKKNIRIKIATKEKMSERIKVFYMCIIVISVLITNSFRGEESEATKAKSLESDIVCKQKVLWKMRMCPDGKLICSKNKKYVDKAKHYIKALGSPNYTRRVKAYNKLMKIAHYILPYIKGEYNRVKKFEQKNALIGYRSLNILKEVDMKIMCEDDEGGFMWYAVISKGAVKTFAPWGFVSLGFILVGNETGVIGGFQVRGYTTDWKVSNYSCDLRDKSRTKFAIEINDGGYNYVVTENTYYKNSKIYPSPSKNFYIIVKSERGKVKAVIDGKESEEYNGIGEIAFSSSGNRYVFIAQKENGKWVAVIDGKESEEYNSIWAMAFSSSGNRYGFMAQKENGKVVAVVDGRESEEYNSIWPLIFSSSGNRYGFIAQKESGRWVAVINDKESEEYNSIWPLIFSSSGNRYGFVARKKSGRWVAVIDGKESEEYNGIGEIAFSYSGNRYGFIAQKENGRWIAVVNGKESEEYKYNRIQLLVFSFSGNRYGFAAREQNGKWVAVIDGKESEEYNYIGQIVFSSSGNRYGFVAEKENGKWVAVIDGRESEEYNGIEEIVFSSSGNRYGFIARKENGKQVAVVDGNESEEYSVILALAFSSTGERYGLVAKKRNGRWVAVIDGKESKEYDNIVVRYTMGRWDLWSSDDKLFVFIGRIKRIGENDTCEAVVNNHHIRTTNCTPDFYFHKNTLKFIEFRNNKIYSVSCKLK